MIIWLARMGLAIRIAHAVWKEGKEAVNVYIKAKEDGEITPKEWLNFYDELIDIGSVVIKEVWPQK